MIAVQRAASRVYGCSGRGVGALIDPVRDAILVGVDGTSGSVYARPDWRSRTLVDSVVDPIAVRVFGTAASIDFRMFDGVGTGVEAVVDAVAVGINRAAARVDDGAAGRPRTRVILIGNPILVRVTKRAWPGQDREPRGADDVSRPIAARERRAGRVDGARFYPEGDLVPEEDPVAECAMNAVICEGVAGVVIEPHPRIAAEDVEKVAGGPEVEDQAAAPQRQPAAVAAGLRRRLLIADIELDADHRAEEVAESPAAADLIVELERAVVARERAERPDFELVRVLTDAEDWNDVETQQQQ